MSAVVSKNPYDPLGNDDGDSDTPKAPVKTVDKTSTHTTKRNTDGLAPGSKASVSTFRRGDNVSGNEAAYRDRQVGSDRNRGRPTDEAGRGGTRGGYSARGRGGRGGRFDRNRDDRHAKSASSGGTDKTAAQAWGATEGEAELNDEQAGEAMAQSEQKEAALEGEGEYRQPETEPETEDKYVSYDAYLAQQAEKKLALQAESLNVRKPNEGVKENKKWATAKPLVKDEDEEYVQATTSKSKRERERKVKQLVDVDMRFVEPERSGRGGRGGRGGGYRVDFRGERGDFRGGDGRGRGRGVPRADFRGERYGGEPQGLNPNDQSAFPSLGS